MIEQLISGGQTGVDQVALIVAQSLGIRTGGTAPKGWRTDDGPAPWLGTQYGLVESYDPGYVVRTVANVRAADMTVWFGNHFSPGGRLTQKTAQRECQRRPEYRWLAFSEADLVNTDLGTLVDVLVSMLTHVKILNVAGNRLRTNPAASELARKILTKALHP